jgi:hypothetical protein
LSSYKSVNINLFLYLVKDTLAKDLLLPTKKGTSIIPQKDDTQSE